MEDRGIIKLSNDRAECKIALFGGNLLSYRLKGDEHDIFWLGDLNKFDNVQVIRGGIPVSWPRFAEEELNNNLPRHGFARLSNWNLKKASVDNEKIAVELSLQSEAKYNIHATVNLYITITDKLEYCLETINNGQETFTFSEALHAYFNISSVDNVKIKGLKGHTYKNSLDGKMYKLEDDLQIKGEVDSIFLNQTEPVEITDSGYNRVIEINKEGSKTTVVWNPNKDLAEMSKEQYKTFVCVEPSNVGDYSIKLAPKEKHQIKVTIKSK